MLKTSFITPPPSLSAIFLQFLAFGCMAWGGPAAQIATLRNELVEKARWVSSDNFNRTLAVYQALPGPEATEMCVYLGMSKCGRWGGLLAGLGFILPGFFLMLLLSWIYTSYGGAAFLVFFAGVQPAVSALIMRAVQRIGAPILISPAAWIAAAFSIIMTLRDVNFLPVLIACGAFMALCQKKRYALAAALLASASLILLLLTQPEISHAPAAASPQNLFSLFLLSLKAGLLSFGGAYTAIPIYQAAAVSAEGWLSKAQFTDGLAITSILPTPVVMFSTFLGFTAHQLSGALLMSIGVFIPAFCFTLFGHRQLEKLINTPKIHHFLDGITAGVIGIFAVTALHITMASVTDAKSAFIFITILITLFISKFRYITPLSILLGALMGIVLQ